MRKSLSLFLALILVIGCLSACGPTTMSEANLETKTKEKPAAEEKPATATTEEKPAESAKEDEAPVAASGETLTLWLFVDTHKAFFEEVTKQFKEQNPGADVKIELMEYNALYDKFTVIMQSGGQGAPDLIDVEQGAFGRFVKGDIPFVPLNDLLSADGKMGAIVPGREALYKWDGNIYGLEHALCPVSLCYRADIFEECGIEVPIETWDDFREAGLKLKEKGYSIMSSSAKGYQGWQDLISRAANSDVVDDNGNVVLNDNWVKVAQMLYDFANTDKIMALYEAGPDQYKLFNENKVATLIAADWGAGMLQNECPDLAGKWKQMPLPKLTSDSSPTSVWGGTGLCMTKYTDKKELAWKFMSLAQLDKDNAIKRYEITNLFPPLIAAFDDPKLTQPSAFFSEQKTGELYAELGKVAPVQKPAWWKHIYGRAYEKFFFDYNSGTLSPADFAAAILKDTQQGIEDEE